MEKDRADKNNKKVGKTNAMRILDKERIEYEYKTYEVDENDLSGEHVAAQIGQDPSTVFKTLVLHGDKTGYIVACIPVERTINLKALARVSGNKSVEMIHVRELLGVTGYIRGGCSPIGMKKHFPTYIDESAREQETIAVSAGQRGIQIIIKPSDLIKAARAVEAELTSETESESE